MKDSKSKLSVNTICREQAIKNLGGMEWLYDKHVAIFLSRYSGSAYLLKQLLNDGQYDEAHLLIHSIKGMAGTLGFNELYVCASHLESAIITSSPMLCDLLSIYEALLQSTAGSRKND